MLLFVPKARSLMFQNGPFARLVPTSKYLHMCMHQNILSKILFIVELVYGEDRMSVNLPYIPGLRPRLQKLFFYMYSNTV